MVFLSGVDDIVGMPIPNAVPARIAKPVRASIRPGTPGKIAKPVLAKIAKPVKARIAPAYYKMVRNGVSGYHLSGFGNPDEMEGVRIDAAVPARIATPTFPRIAPGPDGLIPAAVQATIRKGPTGAIARGPGGDSDSRYGIPFSRTIAPTQITGPTAVLPAFPVPGAGEEAKSLSPLPIMPGPSGKIKTLSQVLTPDKREEALSYIRARLAPVLDALAELPADQRGPALRETFALYGQPNAETAVRRLSAEFIAKGTQPEIAFREALARVLAAAILFVAPIQFLAELDPDDNALDGFTGLGAAWYKEAWSGIKKGAKAVGKFAVKLVHKTNDLIEDVACSDIGRAVADKVATALVSAPPGAGGAASCGSAKMNEYLTAELAYAVGVKKKNPSFKSTMKSIGVEFVKGAQRAGASGVGLDQIKLPADLQKVANDVRAKVDSNQLMSITRKELESKVPSVKGLSKIQLDAVVTQSVDRATNPETYGDPPLSTILMGVSPKKGSRYKSFETASAEVEARKTPAQRAADKAEADRWWKANASRFTSSARTPEEIARNQRTLEKQALKRVRREAQAAVKPKSSKLPLVLAGGVAVGALAYVLMKRKG
jgi:hypothetical protein